MDAMTKTSSGCGCGGGGKSGCGCGSSVPAAACACGDIGCATCRNQGFVRPRFFAGQLLTEEDLQKLVDFVVAKQRLHNQRLWGDGVVCGLEVTCHPCGGGTVQVNPGYALDCCGNDLVLSCPQTLDINAMVRDLKRNLRGGYDCGDPCPPAKKNGQATEENGASTSAAVSHSPVVETTHEPIDTTRHYCLYLRYCETLSEPVTPYATDEGCSNQSCQPTRVNEGVTFELRCSETCEPEVDIRSRLCECIGDLDSAFQTTRRSNAFYFAARMQRQVANVVVNDPIAASNNLINLMSEFRRNRIPQPPSGMPEEGTRRAARERAEAGLPITEKRVEKQEIRVEDFEKWLAELHAADAQLAGYLLAQQTPAKTALTEAKEATEKQVTAGRKELREAATLLKAQIDQISAPELARRFYAAALDRTIELAASRPVLAQPRLQQIANGSLLTEADYQAVGATAAAMAMREELLDRLDLSPRVGDCQLRFDVEAVRVPDEQGSAEQWSRVSAQLHEAWVRYLKECFCAALLPPCKPCDDPAVLLACIIVKDCEVIEICNLKRKFVLSGPALRYWLPPLNWLGAALEKLCCPDPICEEEDETGEEQEVPNSGNIMLTRRATLGVRRKLPGRINFGLLRYLCEPRKKQSLTRQLVPSRFIAGTEAFAERPPLQNAIRNFAAVFARIGMPESTVARPAEFSIRDITAALNREEVAKVAAEVLGVEPARTGEALAAMADEKVAEAVEKLTKSAAKDLKEARTLKKKNTELTKRVEELTKEITEVRDQVTKLQKGEADG